MHCEITNTQEERRFKGLSGTAIKLIALISMVCDHVHYFFGFTGMIPVGFSMLGRIAAPLFMFCLVEGFTHTRDRVRFFLRIYVIAAAMSALLFFMTFGGFLVRPDGFFPMNGMMTTFVILIIVWQGIEWIERKRYLKGILAVVLPVIWPFVLTDLVRRFPALNLPLSLVGTSVLPMWNWLSPDTSMSAMLAGIVLYLFRKNRRLQAAAFAVETMLFDFVRIYLVFSQMPGFAFSQMYTAYYEWYGVLAVIPMLCYNGQRGRGYKKLFYVFYPAHIYGLYALSWGLYLLMH
ncbi:MAG: TraX family protein [Clostridia bacterium]|nr:TraX family protein [Clostridia bacterium]